EPVYWDVLLNAGCKVALDVPLEHNLLVYCYEGAINIGTHQRPLKAGEAGLLTWGEKLDLSATDKTRCLVIGGKPIGEPIAQYGPFVMNTSDEIEQAIDDYRSGKLTAHQ
ncbi:MAG TPA: pirin-like C-terminal cupin domain-containing protein, partial [Cellvibrionaceae bacterium]